MNRFIAMALFIAGIMIAGCGNQDTKKINSPEPADSAVSGGTERRIDSSSVNTIDSADTTH
jgi:hypothetical protein